MELTYDPKYNIAYIRLQPKIEEVESIKISEELIVDVASDGSVYGIELLNANKHLGGELGKRLSIVNKESGEKVDIQIPI